MYGGDETMSDQRLLRLGAHMAEVEALYGRVLESADPCSEERRLAALAEAAGRLAETAGRPGRPAAVRPPAGRTRLERRIIRARRTTEWIIARAGGNPR